MSRTRKYDLVSLPEEAKQLLTLNEMVLFDQEFHTLSIEDQKVFRNARAKISRYMNHDKPKRPRVDYRRLNYQYLPQCIWECLDNDLNIEPGLSRAEINTPPRLLTDAKRRAQRQIYCDRLRVLIRQFFYYQDPFELDCVLQSTWDLLEAQFPESKLLILQHPSKLRKFEDRRVRRLAMEKLSELFRKQASSIVVMNFSLLGRQACIYCQIYSVCLNNHGCCRQL